MANADWSDDIEGSTVKTENNVDIEETCVNLVCVKSELNEERFDFEEDYATQYKITLKYENLIGESTHNQIIKEDYDNLIGFEDNCVIMENAKIKLETVKEEYDWSFNNIYCSKCNGIYKGYCLKCSTLLRILNNNLTFGKSESNDIPRDILEIKETSKGKGIYLLRTLPKNVIFGPFEGILGIESTIGHSWKIIDNKLSNVEFGNWMKNIVCASNASLKNLDALQFNGQLYFETVREITEGEELLIYYDVEELRQIDGEEYLYTPQKKEELPNVFACTTCCFGFGSNKCLMEHKKKCCPMEYTKNTKDFVLVECHYCKMWLENWEHEEYHVAQCLEKHHKMWLDHSKADMDVEEMKDDCGIKDEKTQYSSGTSYDIGLTERLNNEEVHNAIETDKDHLKNHLNKQGGIKKYQCDVCSVRFTQRGNLQKHLNTHKGIKPYQCHICMTKLTTKANLKAHIRNVHTGDGSTKDYKCFECPYQTNYKQSLQRHLNTHAGIKKFKCASCMKRFADRGHLRLHIKNIHTVNGSEKDYNCSECPFRTSYKQSLQKHLNLHKGIKQYQCGICMKRFTDRGSLGFHIKNKHSPNGSEKDYKCSECPYQTNRKSDLQKHLNIHKGIKPFECDICKTKFGQKQKLKMHMKNKHADNTKDYKCPECPYQSNYRHLYQNHLKRHTDIKRFECDICKMTFTRKSSLKRHIKKKHTDAGFAEDKYPECFY